MASPRVTRGRQSEAHVADFLREHGFPHAEKVAASLKGADVTGTPGLAIEVKSRARLELGAWMKQAAKREGLPLLIVRLNGQGPATIEDWPTVTPLGVMVELLREAGYGDEWTPSVDLFPPWKPMDAMVVMGSGSVLPMRTRSQVSA